MLITYILFAKGLAQLARREGIANPYLAFIPIAQLYIVGEILSDHKYVKSGKRVVTIVSALALTYIATLVYAMVLMPPYGMISSLYQQLLHYTTIAVIAYLYILLFFLLKRYTTHALVLTLTSVFIFTGIGLVAIYKIRNNPLLTDNKYAVIEDYAVIEKPDESSQGGV
jgi:hypothetical protein